MSTNASMTTLLVVTLFTAFDRKGMDVLITSLLVIQVVAEFGEICVLYIN